MARRLLILRHGQTEFNATGRMQGQLDTQLSDVGRAQAQATAEELAGWDIRRVISSDLVRAADTAAFIAQAHGLPVHTDPRLRETNLGQWQGRSHQEIDADHPGQRAMWRYNAHWAPPGGETRLEVAARARQVIDELMVEFDQWEEGTVVAVAHGGTIQALTSALLGLGHEPYPIFSGLGNTSWAQLTARPRFRWDGAHPDASDFAAAMEVAPQTRFSPETVKDAQWFLDAWNATAIGIPFAPPEAKSSQNAAVTVTYSLNALEGIQ